MRKSESYTKPTKADANGPESMIAFTFTCKEEHLLHQLQISKPAALQISLWNRLCRYNLPSEVLYV